MMPDLRALFNEPRRLWAGKGTQIRGYADKRIITGMQATGAPAVFTLGRADSTAPAPYQGTGENPVELRAGQGVRLHGYGGIHTLERLPVPTPEEPPGLARLEWEIEESWGAVQVCTLGVESSITPGKWVISSAVTYTGTLGSFTETTTASGVTSAYGPDDSAPDSCATPTFYSTYDPGTDYGTPTGSSTVETLVDPASLVASAIAQLAVSDESSSLQVWQPKEWSDVSDETTPFSFSFGTIGMSYAVGVLVRADNIRFRLRNRGNVPLRVDCGFYGSGISGGATDIPDVIDLAPGATSAWQEVPSIDPDPAKYYTAEIRRVRIGRYRTLA